MENAQFKVLIADDDPSVAKLLERALRSDGYQVLVATDGLQTLDLAIAERPDVLVLDVTMPKMDGYEVTRALREREETRGICIILLTAHQEAELAAKGFEQGADDYIVKPFAPAHLRARVQTWLFRRADGKTGAT